VNLVVRRYPWLGRINRGERVTFDVIVRSAPAPRFRQPASSSPSAVTGSSCSIAPVSPRPKICGEYLSPETLASLTGSVH